MTPLPMDFAAEYNALLASVFSSAVAAKAWCATLAMVLALVQVTTAARIWGKLEGVIPLSGAAAARVHRWSGRLAVLATVPVVFHCITILGFQSTSPRVLVHSIVGSFIYGVLAAKLLAVKDHGFPGWLLPVAGGTMFAGLAVLWFTSSYWYFTEVRFGF